MKNQLTIEPMPDPIHQPKQDKDAAMRDFAAQMRRMREQKEAARAGLLEALPVITKAIRVHWTTGGGYRLRQIVWSLWNGETLVGLYDVLGGLDDHLGQAVSKLLVAQLAGALDNDAYLRRVLTDSGEFARYDEAARDTPEGEDVIYPPLAVSASQLRRLADAAAAKEARYQARCRAEDERERRRSE